MPTHLNNRRIFLTGALSGLIAGFVAFLFARFMVEPFIQRSIDYEGARDVAQEAIEDALKAASIPFPPPGPEVEVFSRGIQRNIGIGVGMMAIGLAFGLLMAVAYRIILQINQGNSTLSIRTTVLLIGLVGWLTVYVVPALKYPANPPAIGHYFTINSRGNLYLVTVLASILFMILATWAARRMVAHWSTWTSVLVAIAGYVALMCILFAVLPNLGHLAQNQHFYGTEVTYGTGDDAVTLPIDTETPLPLKDATGNIVFPGFPADVLSRFRTYSMIAQAIIWLGTGLIMGALLGRGDKASRGRHATDELPKASALA
ncbi:CbtA family protein [Propionibacterium freudenreichii]|uniref:CbtA family protein n=1 Tax=Propionibacterium freudenreichii TaxID=1744 RepID=UPI000BC2DF47|nr:CbtA family protein [Propionibacterium freudenreichii]MDK9294264.1 CbtA family protein [Propionibacterium freudenreichii]MDK9359719.1 CbtA family protein [Propionibacterium freudenreichii]MDK9640202.1 CbtA family protein [Propionibacterium freudenreichii]WGU90446.1 CbtA family protein [Propionibacterium freudenreichii]SCQ77496.1 Putative cobalt transporter subunit (CbtA) (Precursor) [Propionibacterium freudenreichii]